MEVDGRFRKEIRVALLDAFPQLSSLRILVDEVLDSPLQNITLADNLQTIVFDLIAWAVAQGRLAELVLGAASENPGNNRLKDIANRFRFAEANLGENERIVLQGIPFENAGQWLDRLSKIRRAVCRIEPQDETVTIDINRN